MSSWFSAESFQSLKANAASLAGNAAELAGKVVQESGILEKIDHSEMMQKLTLTTPELSAERARIDAEERRKEMVHDKLAGMLPWETRDAERDILVDECKEVILQLSADTHTFTGPWKMPEKGVNLKNQMKKKKTSDDSEEHDNNGGGDSGEEEDDEEEEEDAEENQTSTVGPSQASIEKLEKLQPLPPLLQDFDLDSHVGLIQRLLQEDPALVKMQSTLSGGGAREKVFWHNYFFHCAYTRYEAGLSIDEIWSDQPHPTTAAAVASGGGAAADGTSADASEDFVQDDEHTITFEADDSGTDSATATGSGGGKAAAAAEAGMNTDTPAAESTTATQSGGGGKDSSENAASKDCSDFEMVGGADGNDASNTNALGGDADDEVDYELDELEEEIARELED
jgi:hypothetical protein